MTRRTSPQVYPGVLGDSSEKSALCEELTRALGLPISRITSNRRGEYLIYVAGRRIVLRNLAALQSQRKFRCAVAGALSALIPHFRRAAWDDVVSLLLRAAEPEVIR